MRPLDPLAPLSPIARLLAGAPAAEARAEIARLAALALDPLASAALGFARGALALRDGALDAARGHLEAAAGAFAATGDAEAADLARAEAWLTVVRRGPRAAIHEAVAALDALAGNAASDRARAVALHYRGAAERAAGDAVAAQRSLLAAFHAAEPFLTERAPILNSLGTLYVTLGAHGAAEALLEHAAELHHQHGDATGEAIAHGQLGAAALAQGHLDRARRHLQRQEWLASRIGDAFGQARALCFLAEVALDAGRAAEAAELAERATAVATSVEPPLALWVAYAARALGRARIELGDEDAARKSLDTAREKFARFAHPLGLALTGWDLARLGATSDWFGPAWSLASLGLAPRVARLFADRRALGVAGDGEGAALAAAAQASSHLAAAEEVALVYAAPEALAAVAAQRTAAQRNLGRLAALAIAPRGLVLAAIAAESIGAARHALPPERASAAAIAELPGAAAWAWPATVTPEEVARDLAAARAALGEDTRAALAVRPDARITAPPFQGEVAASLEGVDVLALMATARALPHAALARERDVAWSPEAEALAAMSGLASVAAPAAARG
jgi:tetratricopeptide (TPR) repeat protein